MIVKLRTQQGRKPSPTLILRGPEAIIGRAHGNKVRIPSSEVSRQHCRFRIHENKVTIEDLDSLNGTFLNKKRTEGVEHVRSGDRIQVGPVTFVVELLLAEEPNTSRPEEPEEVAPVDLEEVDVTLVEEEGPPSRNETATKKRKPLPDKDKRVEGKPSARPEPKRPTIEDEFELVPEDEPRKPPPEEEEAPVRVAGARPEVPAKPRKPAPPATAKKPPPYKIEDDELIPLTGEHPREETEAPYVDFDQAWQIPEPTELRDILHGLEHGEAVEDEEKPE